MSFTDVVMLPAELLERPNVEVVALPADLLEHPKFEEALRMALYILESETESERVLPFSVKTWADAEVTRG